MATNLTHVTFPGRLVMVGFGAIGQGVLPLILRHIAMDPKRITIITADDRGSRVAAEFGIRHVQQPLTRENYRAVLAAEVGAGDFLLNLSVDVSSLALIALARELGALYLDTCIEPWPGGYTDPTLSPSRRSNYALRQQALDFAAANPGGPTAVIAHGANPGMVSHMVKRALLHVARDTGVEASVPADRAGWAALSEKLGIKVIHIAERDTQVSNVPKQVGEFVNTWSIDGFVSEGCQPAELGWGSHEKTLPADATRHDFGSGAGIILNRPGAATRVRTWTPLEGPFHGFLITHNEAISIADYLTVGEGYGARYRPTVHYSYHPCDDAVMSVHEFAGKNWIQQPRQRLMMDEIVQGMDELGVLLCGHAKNVYWYGSRLNIDEARKLAPHNSATTLQVTSAVLSGVVLAMESPALGLVEPEQLDFERGLEVQAPYLGELVGVYGDWTPLQDRSALFPEDIDTSDPWQFKNVRVA